MEVEGQKVFNACYAVEMSPSSISVCLLPKLMWKPLKCICQLMLNVIYVFLQRPVAIGPGAMVSN